MKSNQHGQQRFKTSNLYQLNAYLTNKAHEPGWENVDGMLIYPTNGYSLSHHIRLHGKHTLHLHTINLDQSWQQIEADLARILTNQREPQIS